MLRVRCGTAKDFLFAENRIIIKRKEKCINTIFTSMVCSNNRGERYAGTGIGGRYIPSYF